MVQDEECVGCRKSNDGEGQERERAITNEAGEDEEKGRCW